MDLTDPKTLAILMAASGMMSGAPGQRRNFVADIGHGLMSGLQGYNQGRVMQTRQAEEDQQREMMRMRMDEMRQQQQQRTSMQNLAQRAFAPPQALDPRQQEGGQQEIPGGGGVPEFARGMMNIDPMVGMQMMPKPEKPKMAFAPDGRAVDMNALTPGDNYGKQPEWKDPAYQEFALKKAREGASRVNVDTRQETEFAKSLGKQQGEDYASLMKNDAMASGKINKLTRLETLLDSSGKTGKLTPATMELKAVADSLGFKVDPKLQFQQAAQALSQEIALEMRNPSGGAGMPGALSDQDRKFLQDMVPNLAKTPGGNKELLQTYKKLAQREKEVAKLAREYRTKTGRFDEGFYQVLSDYSAKNPLFSSKREDEGWSARRVED
jgi:hypothetical protein